MPSKMEKTKWYFWSLHKKQKGNLDVVKETFYVFRFFRSASSGIFLEIAQETKKVIWIFCEKYFVALDFCQMQQ